MLVPNKCFYDELATCHMHRRYKDIFLEGPKQSVWAHNVMLRSAEIYYQFIYKVSSEHGRTFTALLWVSMSPPCRPEMGMEPLSASVILHTGAIN